jgi:hypothetical protein
MKKLLLIISFLFIPLVSQVYIGNMSGFETGRVDEAPLSGSMTFATTTVRSGTYALLASTTSSNGTNNWGVRLLQGDGTQSSTASVT